MIQLEVCRDTSMRPHDAVVWNLAKMIVVIIQDSNTGVCFILSRHEIRLQPEYHESLVSVPDKQL